MQIENVDVDLSNISEKKYKINSDLEIQEDKNVSPMESTMHKMLGESS